MKATQEIAPKPSQFTLRAMDGTLVEATSTGLTVALGITVYDMMFDPMAYARSKVLVHFQRLFLVAAEPAHEQTASRHQFGEVPYVIGDPCRHRRGHAQRPVNAAKVVVRHEQPDHRAKVRQLLREAVREPSKAAHLHSERQVVPLDAGRADAVPSRASLNALLVHADDGWWTVATTPGVLFGIDLCDLRVVNLAAVVLVNGIAVGGEGVGTELDAAGNALTQLADEFVRRAQVTLADTDYRHQIGCRVDGDEGVSVSDLAYRAFLGRHSTLLLLHEAPYFVGFDLRASEIAHALVHHAGAPLTGALDQPQDGGFVDPRDARNGPNRGTFDQHRQNQQLPLVLQDVHSGLLFHDTGPARARYTTTGLPASIPICSSGCVGVVGCAVLKHRAPSLKVVPPAGLEPATLRLAGGRSFLSELRGLGAVARSHGPRFPKTSELLFVILVGRVNRHFHHRLGLRRRLHCLQNLLVIFHAVAHA